jgi:uncharacterized protein with PIN domain
MRSTWLGVAVALWAGAALAAGAEGDRGAEPGVNPPQTSQVSFTSSERCEAAREMTERSGQQARDRVAASNAAAREEVTQEQAHAQSEAEAQYGHGVILGASPAQIEKLKGQPLPTVSAVCLTQ